jgi:ankyrin repeat protein
MLREEGLLINHTDATFGNSVLHYADCNPTVTAEIFDILINAGADVNLKSKNGTNPLSWYLQNCGSTTGNDVDPKIVRAYLRSQDFLLN